MVLRLICVPAPNASLRHQILRPSFDGDADDWARYMLARSACGLPAMLRDGTRCATTYQEHVLRAFFFEAVRASSPTAPAQDAHPP